MISNHNIMDELAVNNEYGTIIVTFISPIGTLAMTED